MFMKAGNGKTADQRSRNQATSSAARPPFHSSLHYKRWGADLSKPSDTIYTIRGNGQHACSRPSSAGEAIQAGIPLPCDLHSQVPLTFHGVRVRSHVTPRVLRRCRTRPLRQEESLPRWSPAEALRAVPLRARFPPSLLRLALLPPVQPLTPLPRQP